MIPGLLPVSIKELKALSTSKEWPIEGYLDEIASITPIRGMLIAGYQENTLKVKGNFSTIINLICDRCALNYNYSLMFNSEEFILIGDEKDSTEDLPLNELAEYIFSSDNFDPERWVIEQLSLQVPLINICSDQCLGPITINKENLSPSISAECIDQQKFDPRWSQLKRLLIP